MKDWNEFMTKWDDLHRNEVCVYMRNATKEQRKKINLLKDDLRSSLKWCRFNDCTRIYYMISEILNKEDKK